MRIAITGASGFIGGRLMGEFSGRNVDTVGVCRTRYTRGDILDRDYLRNVLKDVDVVYHCAAVVGGGGRKNEYVTNTKGTENVIDMAVENNVKRFVHLSSLAVLGEYTHHRGVTEDIPYASHWKDPYTPSKIEAEKIVIARKDKLDVYLVRPGWVWGPGDKATQKMMELIREGRFRFIGDGENLTYFTHIDNLVSVLLILGEINGVNSGAVFNITDGYKLKLREFVDTICSVMGREPVKKRVPVSMAEILAWLSDMVLKNPDLTRQNVAIMSHDLYFPVEKAKTVLGYDPDTALERQVREAAEYFNMV